MTVSEAKKLSKFMSLVLRHQPETINLTLDNGGWADIRELIAKSKPKSIELDTDKLRYLVENNDKKRFSISEDSTKITYQVQETGTAGLSGAGNALRQAKRY